MMHRGLFVTLTLGPYDGETTTMQFLSESPDLMEEKIRWHMEKCLKGMEKSFRAAKRGDKVYCKTFSISVELTNYINQLDEGVT